MRWLGTESCVVALAGIDDRRVVERAEHVGFEPAHQRLELFRAYCTARTAREERIAGEKAITKRFRYEILRRDNYT